MARLLWHAELLVPLGDSDGGGARGERGLGYSPQRLRCVLSLSRGSDILVKLYHVHLAAVYFNVYSTYAVHCKLEYTLAVRAAATVSFKTLTTDS